LPSRRVGLIGCGTIGSQLAIAIDSGKVPNATLVSLFDVVAENAQSLQGRLEHRAEIFGDFDRFLQSEIETIVEAASQQAVRSFANSALASGKDLMVMSVGALADPHFLTELLDMAQKHSTRIYIPSGAIAGIDAIRSVKNFIGTVTLTTTKHPKALAGAPFFAERGIKPEEIMQKTEIFTGPASEAVKLFPANVNVAAVLGLAGIGPAKTRVRIVADPNTKTNKHDISASGSFGEIQISVDNVPSPGNPKTSYLAILSAIECLRSICDDSIRIGT
jgi:aspartate dehydrogenase